MTQHIKAEGAERFPGGRDLESFGTVQKERFESFRKHRAEKIDFAGCEDTLYGEFITYVDGHIRNLTQVNQYLRYCNTFRRIYDQISPEDKIVEAGGFSIISEFLSSKGYDCTAAPGDFRYSIEAESDSYDVLFSLETLEHIKDQDSDKLSDIVHFNFSGMKAYMSEMARLLRKGGRLYLTTPNSNSLLVLARWLRFQPSFMSPVHPRELTKEEILALSEPYFTLTDYATSYSYGLLDDGPDSQRARLIKLLGEANAKPEERGDNHFFVLTKK